MVDGTATRVPCPGAGVNWTASPKTALTASRTWWMARSQTRILCSFSIVLMFLSFVGYGSRGPCRRRCLFFWCLDADQSCRVGNHWADIITLNPSVAPDGNSIDMDDATASATAQQIA